MIAYASRTGTRRNLKAMRDHGWRIMVSATGAHRTEGFPYAIDNGAWTAYQKGEPFNVRAFENICLNLGRRADFIVIPDIVAGGMESLEFSLSWLPRLESKGTLLLLPVQDGMTVDDVKSYLCDGVGIFVGGSTGWKEATIRPWGDLAREVGCYLHIGRVNTRRRIKACHMAGADSFDGSSVTRFAKTIHALDAERRQSAFWFYSNS